jgi:hypothetical protein
LLTFQTSNPTPEPVSFFAGDSAKWTKTLPDYSASNGWTLTYFFSGKNPFKVDGVANGISFDITISPTESASYPPGMYRFYARASKGTTTIVVSQGQMEILTNPAKIGAGTDVRSHWQIVYDSLEKVIEKQSVKGYEELEITMGTSHRRLKNMTWNDILIAFHHAENELRREADADRLKQGLKRRRILTRASVTL